MLLVKVDVGVSVAASVIPDKKTADFVKKVGIGTTTGGVPIIVFVVKRAGIKMGPGGGVGPMMMGPRTRPLNPQGKLILGFQDIVAVLIQGVGRDS